MRIGIDIDNTLTDVQDKLTQAARLYAESLKKTKNNNIIEINDSGNDGSIYQKLFGFSYDELKHFLGPIQEEITNNALPRDYCVEIIRKLHDEGNEIYIITARDEEFHDNPYKQSREWLEKNNIYFDKLIVNARDKGKICVENNIDLFIDDSLTNCKDVLNYGIESITICNDNQEGIKNYNTIKIDSEETDEFEKLHNEIFEKNYSKKLSIVIEYIEKFFKERTFINCLSNEKLNEINKITLFPAEYKYFLSILLAYFIKRGKKTRYFEEAAYDKLYDMMNQIYDDLNLDRKNFEENVYKELGTKEQLKIKNIISCFDDEKLCQLANFYIDILGI